MFDFLFKPKQKLKPNDKFYTFFGRDYKIIELVWRDTPTFQRFEFVFTTKEEAEQEREKLLKA